MTDFFFEINCGEVWTCGAVAGTLDYASDGFQTSLSGQTDGFAAKVQALTGPILYDNNLFCRGNATKSNGTTLASSRKETELWAYPKNGFFYGNGVWYNSTTNKYYFNADSMSSSSSSATIYYRIAWEWEDNNCAVETEEDFGVINGRFNPIHKVMCPTATPGIDSLRFRFKPSYPSGFSISVSYDWYDAIDLATECSTRWCATIDHSNYEPRMTFTGFTDGCKYVGATDTFNDDSTRIRLKMNYAYDYYDDGNVSVNIRKDYDSWYRYFNYTQGNYAGYQWWEGFAQYTSGQHISTTNGYTTTRDNQALPISGDGLDQGSYYIRGRHACSHSKLKTLTHKHGDATVTSNAHCRTDKHEKVLDPNSPSWSRIRVKEGDGSDYFDATKGKFYIRGRVDLLPGVDLTLTGKEIVLGPKSQIWVYPGAELDLTNCQITTCDADDPWHFIKVMGSRGSSYIKHGDGKIIFDGTAGSPVIEYGKLALVSIDGGQVTVENTTFNGNRVSFYAQESPDDNELSISGSTFENRKAYPGGPFAAPDQYPSGVSGHVILVDVQDFDFLTNTITGGGASDDAYGVYMKYTDSDYGPSTIDGNTFEKLYAGVGYFHSSPPASGSTALTDNRIQKNKYGVVVFSHAESTNLFGCITGCSNPNSSTTNNINLNIGCNEVYCNDVGIIGGGKLIDQGVDAGSSHGNDWGTTGSTMNHHYDFMWDGTAVNWFNASASTAPNNNFTASSPDYCISCASVSYSGIDQTDDNVGQTNNCGSVPPIMAIEPAAQEEVNIQLYPNPFDNILNVNIQLEDENRAIITMYDLQGREVYSNPNSATGMVTIPTDNLRKGAYILQIRTAPDKAPNVYKVIKN